MLQVVSTLAGSATHGNADGQGGAASFNSPTGVAVDSAGTVYVADGGNHRIRKVTSVGLVTTLAGSTLGFADGQGAAAQFSSPHDVAVDADGNVYVADKNNHRVRRITPGGLVSTLAGSTSGFADGQGAAARFNTLHGLCWDAAQSRLLVADTDNHRVRSVNVSTGTVTTLAGSAASGTVDGPVATATLRRVTDIAVDSSGNVFISDSWNHKIRKLSAAGVVSSLAGSQFRSNFANGAALSTASFNTPNGVAVNASGHVFVGDYHNQRVRIISPA